MSDETAPHSAARPSIWRTVGPLMSKGFIAPLPARGAGVRGERWSSRSHCRGAVHESAPSSLDRPAPGASVSACRSECWQRLRLPTARGRSMLLCRARGRDRRRRIVTLRGSGSFAGPGRATVPDAVLAVRTATAPLPSARAGAPGAARGIAPADRPGECAAKIARLIGPGHVALPAQSRHDQDSLRLVGAGAATVPPAACGREPAAGRRRRALQAPVDRLRRARAPGAEVLMLIGDALDRPGDGRTRRR